MHGVFPVLPSIPAVGASLGRSSSSGSETEQKMWSRSWSTCTSTLTAPRCGFDLHDSDKLLLLASLQLLTPAPHMPQLLDLHGRESYLLCDVTKAHEYLWTLPLTDGYSPDVIEGRRELLDSIKERALLQEGKVKQQDKGIDVPVQLLPSALALLAQVCGSSRSVGLVATPMSVTNSQMRLGQRLGSSYGSEWRAH